MVAIACVMVLTGVGYIAEYSVNAKNISTAYIADHKYFKDMNLDNAVLYPIFKEKLPYTLPAIISGTWISEAWNNSSISNKAYLTSFGNRKIYLVGTKDCATEYFSKDNIIKRGNILIIQESTMIVEDLIFNGKFNLDSIKNKGFKSKDCE